MSLKTSIHSRLHTYMSKKTSLISLYTRQFRQWGQCRWGRPILQCVHYWIRNLPTTSSHSDSSIRRCIGWYCHSSLVLTVVTTIFSQGNIAACRTSFRRWYLSQDRELKNICGQHDDLIICYMCVCICLRKSRDLIKERGQRLQITSTKLTDLKCMEGFFSSMVWNNASQHITLQARVAQHDATKSLQLTTNVQQQIDNKKCHLSCR